jgi:hypothetical protein
LRSRDDIPGHYRHALGGVGNWAKRLRMAVFQKWIAKGQGNCLAPAVG